MSNVLAKSEVLSVGQMRHLTASLAQVERHLLEILALVDKPRGSPTPTLFGRETPDLPAGFGETARPSIASASATLTELVSTFGLQAPDFSQFRTVQALVITSVVVVEDAASRHMRGYGQIHPELPRMLDPLLSRLREQLLEIGRALSPPSSTEESSA
ncbi:MAG TPA: hypothetical protein VH438_16370 [Gemmatimonadales bacterium]|jgi:hypothetical protein